MLCGGRCAAGVRAGRVGSGRRGNFQSRGIRQHIAREVRTSTSWVTTSAGVAGAMHTPASQPAARMAAAISPARASAAGGTAPRGSALDVS
eukprot:7376439-Prymnesium_polylepis.2